MQAWVTCFNETAEILLDHNGESLANLRETNEAEFEKVLLNVISTSHVFMNKAELETYNDVKRVKITAMKILPMN